MCQQIHRGKSTSGRKKVAEISSVEASRESLQMERISSNAAKLISHLRRKSSTTNCESSWRRRSSWCNERQVNTFQEPVNYIINFLSENFDKGLQYRALNSLRSTISACYVHIDGKPVEKYPRFCALYLIQDLHNLDMFLYGMWRMFCGILRFTCVTIHPLVMQT